MSILQNKQPELRYLRRKNLEQEAKVVGNYYRDIIRSYGCDVNYYKLNTNEFDNYKGIIDQNTLLKHAYGYNISPDYSMSAEMLSYMEVEQDIFQINKFGYKPDANVTFYFDSNDFACALASKLGQYKEIKIDEIEIECEIPEMTNKQYLIKDQITHDHLLRAYLSNDIFPYKLGFGRNEFYCADMLSGKFQVDIEHYEFDKEQTVECDAYEHTLLSSAFKANPYLYKTFYHNYQNNEYLNTMLYLTFTVHKTIIGHKPKKFKEVFPIINISDIDEQLQYCYDYFDVQMTTFENFNIINIIFDIERLKKILKISICKDKDYVNGHNLNKVIHELMRIVDVCKRTPRIEDITKCILAGKLHGSILFYDLNKIGKYLDKIHPEVGDIVTIDFPDENNREQYEITDAFDKQLQSDGISPLLHKYIWKCNAKRHINNYDDVEHNDANDRLEEKIKYQQIVDNKIAAECSIYDDNQDAVYGGYGNMILAYDNSAVDNCKQQKYEFIDDGTALDIMKFDCGSKILTTGYELLFMTDNLDVYKITTVDEKILGNDAYAESNLKYLKATDSALVYTNILGDSQTIVANEELNNRQLELDITSLYDKTTDESQDHEKYGSFYTFKNTKTYLFATKKHLFCKLASNNKTYQIV